jgi:hypothetical protein
MVQERYIGSDRLKDRLKLVLLKLSLLDVRTYVCTYSAKHSKRSV